MLKSYQFKTHCKGDSHSSKCIGWIGTLLWSSYLLTPPKPLFCSRVLLISSVVPVV